MGNNILILSAGRRVELLESFILNAKSLGLESRVFGADMSPEMSPACLSADSYFEVPRVTSDDYIDTLLSLCLENDIKLVVPTIDTELKVLSKYKEKFGALDIEVVISDLRLIKYCRDKRLTAKWFEELSIDNPIIFEKDNIQYPCFCKPYDGSCSKGALVIPTKNELSQKLLNDPKNMFMELIPKTYSEYTVDGYYDQYSQLKCLVPRKRLEVRSGEVSKGVTRKNFVYDYLLPKIKELPGAIGCITFQFFVNEETMAIKGLEVNPRFGGGFPLSDAAGANFTKWIIQEYLLNEKIRFFDSWESDLLMLRYDAKVVKSGFVK